MKKCNYIWSSGWASEKIDWHNSFWQVQQIALMIDSRQGRFLGWLTYEMDTWGWRFLTLSGSEKTMKVKGGIKRLAEI